MINHKLLITNNQWLMNHKIYNLEILKILVKILESLV